MSLFYILRNIHDPVCKMTDLLFSIGKYREFVRILAGWYVKDAEVSSLMDAIEDGTVNMDAVFVMLTKPRTDTNFRLSESMSRLPSESSILSDD